jgi:hypothetical protein
MTAVYIRKSGARAIHIRAEDGTTRCFPGRYQTRDWEIVEPGERDWQDVCGNCVSTPEDPEAFWEARQAENERRRVVREITGRRRG